jgi:hypothetical protein
MMSDAEVLLSELHHQGKTITVLASILRIVPKVTDAALVERLRAHKEELLDLLTDGGTKYADADDKYAVDFEFHLAAGLAAGDDYFTAARYAAARASKENGGSNDAVTARIVAMDLQRNERDRAHHRGYDNDKNAPSHQGRPGYTLDEQTRLSDLAYMFRHSSATARRRMLSAANPSDEEFLLRVS